MSTYRFDRQTFGDPANAGNVLTRTEAYQLLTDWVVNERLRLHMRQVAHLMNRWAVERESLSEADQWRWEMAGLLHDADWDQWPDQHCRLIVEELEQRNIDPEIIHAIASHGPAYFGVDPAGRMGHMLYAFDELSGFLHAYALMRPNRYEGMAINKVVKQLKDKRFAANVSREDIQDAATRCGVELEELIGFAIRHQGDVPEQMA